MIKDALKAFDCVKEAQNIVQGYSLIARATTETATKAMAITETVKKAVAIIAISKGK